MRARGLKEASVYLRGTPARGLVSDGSVIRDGGDSGAGLIRGIAIVTKGEALGHDMFLDAEFLDQTAAAMNVRGKAGIKSRFTHPDLSGDGLGTLLGRSKNGRVVGDRVIGDLHLAKSSRTTPSGDLGGHVMDLAEESPDLFGTSIVFRRDEDAEELFIERNLNRVGKFVSPDSTNTENFPHARLAELRAVDAVDEPAANSGGMFTTRSSLITADADALLDYALGRSDVEPVMTELSFSPARVKEWLFRWMKRTGMEIVQSAIPAPAGLSSIAEVGNRTDDDRKRYAESVSRFCNRELSKYAVWRVEQAVRSLEGHDCEVADRKRYA
ncbi:MAG: hypothetical protein IID41_05100 [Planctomycetes bacterium]|nr:hypothetical protein [Planctomycetota bacterium]